MSGLEAMIEAVLTDPLARAQAAPRAIGYVGFDIPEDLLAAPGLTACHLPWRTGIATPRADPGRHTGCDAPLSNATKRGTRRTST